MTTDDMIANPKMVAARWSKLRDYYALTKPEVNLLVVMTTATGFYLGSDGPLRVAALINTVLGTLLVASGTATLNQWMERQWDARMRRTAKRPLPAGRLNPGEAFLFGVALSVAGGLYLALTVNGLCSLLAISTQLSYLVIYTPLKRITPLCTLLGAFPGAMPTMIGWAGGAGSIEERAWFLFAILFLWQFPHFLAIALMYRDDYSRAGYHMLPGFDNDSRFTRFEILTFAVALVLTTMLPGIHAGLGYAAIVFSAGAFLLFHALRLSSSPSTLLARHVVHASIIYLPVILGVLVVYKR